MNERIRQLEDACWEELGEDECYYPVFNKEKFAELIVRECVKSTLSLRDTAIDNQWNLDETFHVIVDTIAEDFDMQHIFRS
jgi:hypothetical protein